jgi:LytS/YehU family sensor histidine kinase
MALAEELDVIEGYFEIQKIRFQGRLDVSIDVPPALRDAQVPYLILQPLAENAVKHGASQVRGEGCITIRARRDGGDLVIEVQDNGPGLPADGRDPGGIGLQNVQARLEELYGPASSLAVDPVDEGEGVITTLRLPYHTEDDLYAPGETVPAHEGRASRDPDPAPTGGAAAPNGSSDTAAGAETDPAPTSSLDHG